MMFNNHFVVAIKTGGKVLREHKDTVFLPFGQEYSIYLKNLNTKRAAVRISIDGTDVLSGDQLVVEANSEVNLERFLDGSNYEGRRFKFIERTSDIEQHRGVGALDGVIRVEYQFELARPIQIYPMIYPQQPWLTPTIGDSWKSDWDKHDYFTTISDNTLDDGHTSNVSDMMRSRGVVGGASFSSNTMATSGSVGSVPPAVNYAEVNTAGITAKGSKSYQSFTTTSLGTMESQSHVITLQLKGEVGAKPIRTPITVKTKKTCPSCGRKYPSTSEYCSHDGTFLEY